MNHLEQNEPPESRINYKNINDYQIAELPEEEVVIASSPSLLVGILVVVTLVTI